MYVTLEIFRTLMCRSQSVMWKLKDVHLAIVYNPADFS